MLATSPATRLFLKRAVIQGAKTTARALSTQATASSSIWSPSFSSLVSKNRHFDPVVVVDNDDFF
jgi:hypothetical protein